MALDTNRTMWFDYPRAWDASQRAQEPWVDEAPEQASEGIGDEKGDCHYCQMVIGVEVLWEKATEVLSAEFDHQCRFNCRRKCKTREREDVTQSPHLDTMEPNNDIRTEMMSISRWAEIAWQTRCLSFLLLEPSVGLDSRARTSILCNNLNKSQGEKFHWRTCIRKVSCHLLIRLPRNTTIPLITCIDWAGVMFLGGENGIQKSGRTSPKISAHIKVYLHEFTRAH